MLYEVITQIFLVDFEDGQSEGDPVVVADGDAWQRRLTATDHVEIGRGQMRDVAQRRYAVCAMRIVGEYGATGRRSSGGNRPIVATDVEDILRVITSYSIHYTKLYEGCA